MVTINTYFKDTDTTTRHHSRVSPRPQVSDGAKLKQTCAQNNNTSFTIETAGFASSTRFIPSWLLAGPLRRS